MQESCLFWFAGLGQVLWDYRKIRIYLNLLGYGLSLVGLQRGVNVMFSGKSYFVINLVILETLTTVPHGQPLSTIIWLLCDYIDVQQYIDNCYAILIQCKGIKRKGLRVIWKVGSKKQLVKNRNFKQKIFWNIHVHLGLFEIFGHVTYM